MLKPAVSKQLSIAHRISSRGLSSPRARRGQSERRVTGSGGWGCGGRTSRRLLPWARGALCINCATGHTLETEEEQSVAVIGRVCV
jgi:hypothetical protein